MFDYIKNEIASHDIVLFMKGTATSPACGFSATVVSILQNLKVEFKDINIFDSEELRQEIKKYSEWPTIPQLYIKGKFIGGCDIAKEMYNSGELKDLLIKSQILNPNPAAEE